MRARDRIKQKLLELLKTTPADQLAVKTLVMEAHISKQTLYNNFYGIQDAVCELVCDLFDEASEEYFGQENWMTGMKESLKMLDDHKDVMMHLWNSKWRYDILMGLIKRYMRERMEQDPEKLLTIYGAILEKDTSYGLRRISELKEQAK